MLDIQTLLPHSKSGLYDLFIKAITKNVVQQSDHNIIFNLYLRWQIMYM